MTNTENRINKLLDVIESLQSDDSGASKDDIIDEMSEYNKEVIKDDLHDLSRQTDGIYECAINEFKVIPDNYIIIDE